MINNLGIRNYRSFDQEGVFLENLSKVNIIIGKNNSGKSNILRFLKELSKSNTSLHNFPSKSAINQHRENDKFTQVGFDLSYEELGWQSVIQSIYPRITDVQVSDYIPNPARIWLTTDRERVTYEDLPSEIHKFNINELSQLISLKHLNKEQVFAEIVDRINSSFRLKLRTLTDMVYISDIRVIGADTGNSDINGKNIIERLFQMQKPDFHEKHIFKTYLKIQELVKNLLNVSNLKIDIPHTKDKILVEMHGQTLPLESFGSGIYQLILLCCALVIYENQWICIEEPESHLHPELQRKFLDFLLTKTSNRYFITTHSNMFINLASQISIYHIEYDGIKSSLYKVESSIESYKLLDDLGYKASDLIQANGVIWVEGPSDRNYLLKWISLVDNSLEEGLHFSIMFYGGKNLANVTFTNNPDFKDFSALENLIPLLKINRNAIVLIDSDIIGKKTKINSTKQRIKKEIGNENCWITRGKEIENYISSDVIKKWLSGLGVYDESTTAQKSKTLFSDCVNLADKTKKIDYNLRKNYYSKEISKFFTKADLDYEGLKLNVLNLVEIIKRWNHLS